MSTELSIEERNELKVQGFSDADINSALNEVEHEELDKIYKSSQVSYQDDPRNMSQQSAFATKIDENLIRWQLELNDILERAEHILRGDVPKYTKGVLIWTPNPNADQNPLNDIGIQEVMKILALYINRNTILSDYDNKEINLKVFDFGRRINNFFFMRYEEIGMNTDDKRKHYELLIGELVDLVHSAYKRALHGGERRSLREMISVTQSHQVAGYSTEQGMISPFPQRERSMFNPMRLLKGKYGT